MAEEIRFPIVGEDRGATRVLKDVGRESAVTAAQTRLLAESLDKEKRAASSAADALLKVEKAATLVAITERKLDEEARRAELAMRGEANAAQKLGRASGEAAGKGGIGALLGGGGAGGGGMAGLIGAGVALSPVLVTLGFGLGGLAAAAYGVAKPIANAAQKAGGLQKNLGTLDAEQRTVARGILGLGKQFGTFQNSLKPEILGIFNDGLRIAGHLLGDVQPVAAATGKALGGVLASVDRTFQSGTWQQFFGFMAQQATPDIRLLGDTFNQLLLLTPPLLIDLNSLARGILIIADDTTKAAREVQHFYDAFQKNVPVSNTHTINFLRDLDRWTVDLTNHIPGAKAVNDWFTHVQHNLDGTAAAAGPAVTGLVHVQGVATDLIHPLGAASDELSSFSNGIFTTGNNATDLIHPLEAASGGIFDTGNNAKAAAVSVKALTTWVTNLNTAESKSLDTQLAYSNALITGANDAKALRQALRASHDAVGLHTQAERNSFAAANTYIADLENTAKQAVASGKGASGAAKAIRNGLPVLEQAARHNHALWLEVQTLKGWLDKLRGERPIHETVTVKGRGSFIVVSPSGGLPGGTAGGPFGAAGAYIRQGTTPTADDVVARVSKGELIVPTHMVAAGLVDHLRGAIPGFAGGGIVPSYQGAVAGLPPWGTHNLNASVSLLEHAVARATAAGIRSAMSAPGGSGGPASGAVAALQRYAASLFGQYGWSTGQLPALIALWNGESGWNPNARNPSSGAFGIPQALPPGKMGAAAASGNAAAQIRWGESYIASTYGSPIGAYNLWLSRSPHWYGNGGSAIYRRPAVIGVGDSGPERVTVTPLGQGRGGGVTINNNFGPGSISQDVDVTLISQRQSFQITAAGLS